jgi:hypothetical protein
MSTSNQEIDSLKLVENANGTFQMEWDKEDPKWSWMNNLTSAEIQVIMEQAIREELNRND